MELVAEIEPWSPKKVLGKGHDNNLGFRFYRLEWTPVL